MEIAEYTQTENLQEQIEFLKIKREEKPDISNLKKQWKVSEHKTIKDKNYLPDKEIKDEEGRFLRYKKVNRLAVPFQKLIVNSAVTFGFGNEVELVAEFKPNSEEAKVYQAIKFMCIIERWRKSATERRRWRNFGIMKNLMNHMKIMVFRVIIVLK